MTRRRGKKTTSENVISPLRIGAGILLALPFLLGGNIAVRNFISEVDIYGSYRQLNTPAYLQAEVTTRRAVRLNPQSGYAHYFLASFLKKLGRDKEAVEEFNIALRTIAHPATVLRAMGGVILEEKNYSLAAEIYRRALLFDPMPHLVPAYVWFNFARAAEGAGLTGDALAAFRKAQGFEHPPPGLEPSVGFLLAYLNSPLEGVEAYIYALRKYPELTGEFPNWARAISAAGMPDFGIALFSRLDASGKLDARGLCLLASFSLQKKDYATAMRVLERAEKKNPDEANVYLLMGEVYYARGEKAKMRKMYRRFIEMYPDAPQRRALERRMCE